MDSLNGGWLFGLARKRDSAGPNRQWPPGLIDVPSIGKAILKRRKQLGWSQLDLSQIVGCAPDYIRQIEKGKHSPTVELFDEIVTAMGMRPSEIYAQAEAIKGGYELELPGRDRPLQFRILPVRPKARRRSPSA